MPASPSKKAKTGFYADPRSPIASTPLKRQRNSTPHPTSEKKARVEALDIAALAPEDDIPITTRRLDMNFDDEDDDKRDEKRDEICDENSHDIHNKENDVDLFSPALKVDRHSKPPSQETTVIETPEEEEEADQSSSQKDDDACEVDFNPFYFMKTLPHYDEVKALVRPVALPAKTEAAPKICLVLDLDETLVHCTIDDLPQADMKFPIEYDNHEYMVSVKRRPFMMEFLAQVSEWFEVVVFTASQRVYAEKLLDLLDPYNQFIQHRLYRENCLPVDGNYLKDLNVLGRDLAHVLLIDNSPHAFGYQVSNGIPIESWFHDESDTELLKLLPFLESLVHADDVRPVVTEQFQIQRLIDSAVME
ncbi:unnamed protein product [Aphanomyces euteiches]|uniref:FCP1 homology domain-containing protein n=1 Tax=Aphanomyces euteiches TaxID=100861 RepID=A0A6G0W6V7_9STRA|nr:hypothetical protein Ae201684_018600 [Aphanomyces euteiches]KAH9144212.1 hypothetical protein AeRB84_011837 [Aphanomyces euteiches]